MHLMGTNTDTITNCPAHLASALADARARWSRSAYGDCRAHHAAEVLQHAAGLFNSRSWDDEASLSHALLGAWLANLSHSEDAARIASAPKAADLGTLTTAEIALILAARKAAQ